jgi:hypothetical protein
MVRGQCLLLRGRLVCPNIKPSINLAGVGGDDLTLKILS